MSREWEMILYIGRTYLQNIYLIKCCHPKYTKNLKAQQRENEQNDLKTGKNVNKHLIRWYKDDKWVY